MRILTFIYLTIIFILTLTGYSLAIPQEGQPATEFNLPDLYDSSKIYSLKDFKGKTILLNIWGGWCTGCQAEIPEFMALQDEYKGKGFVIVAVSIDNNPQKAVDFLRKLEDKTHKKVNFIVLHDKDKQVAREYKPRVMPTSYLIGRDGNILKIFPASFNKDNIDILKKAVEGGLK